MTCRPGRPQVGSVARGSTPITSGCSASSPSQSAPASTGASQAGRGRRGGGAGVPDGSPSRAVRRAFASVASPSSASAPNRIAARALPTDSRCSPAHRTTPRLARCPGQAVGAAAGCLREPSRRRTVDQGRRDEPQRDRHRGHGDPARPRRRHPEPGTAGGVLPRDDDPGEKGQRQDRIAGREPAPAQRTDQPPAHRRSRRHHMPPGPGPARRRRAETSAAPIVAAWTEKTGGPSQGPPAPGDAAGPREHGRGPAADAGPQSAAARSATAGAASRAANSSAKAGPALPGWPTAPASERFGAASPTWISPTMPIA